jgi:hypothetical protein
LDWVHVTGKISPFDGDSWGGGQSNIVQATVSAHIHLIVVGLNVPKTRMVLDLGTPTRVQRWAIVGQCTPLFGRCNVTSTSTIPWFRIVVAVRHIHIHACSSSTSSTVDLFATVTGFAVLHIVVAVPTSAVLASADAVGTTRVGFAINRATACVSNIVAIITATTAGRRCKGTKMRCIIATYIVVRVSMNGILHRTSTVARYFMILARTFLVFSSTPWPFSKKGKLKK